MADKVQIIRVIDVVAIGPFMIYAARHLPTRETQLVMFLLGVATMIYNGLNFLSERSGVS